MKKSAWAIILDSEGYVLLLRRAKTCNNPGLYNFPGGSVDKGENPEKSARRELKEEAGLSLKLKPLISITDKKVDKKSYYCIVRVDKRPIVNINDESDAYIWVPLNEMLAYPLHPPTFNFFKALSKDKVNL